MPEKTVRRRLQDCDATLASDHGPIFSTVAKLVEALKRSFPRERKTRSAKKEALRPPTPRDQVRKATIARCRRVTTNLF